MGESENPQFLDAKNSLMSPDYIMEPGVAKTVKTYIRHGGKPSEVVALLTNNYEAMAQHVNLLAEWLILR
jgi:hypothetical protein